MFSKYLICLYFLSTVGYSFSQSFPRVYEVKLTENPLEDVGGKDTLVLTCIAKGENISLTWKFNNVEIKINSLTKLSKNNSQLKIEEVKSAQSGRYRCIATNHFGSSFGQIDVRVHTMGDFEQGYLVGDPAKVIDAQLGKPLYIKCPPHKEGYGQIYWWGDFPEMTVPILWKTGDPSKYGFSADHGEYIFAYMTQKDVDEINLNGGISCILYQSQHFIQSVKQKINVVAEDDNTSFPAKLEAYMPEKSFVVKGLAFHTINCGAIGRPLPKITWFKDGKEIREGYLINNGGMTLNIRPVTFESAGTYRCVAKNDLGSSEKEGKLIVQSHPQFTKELEASSNVNYGDSLKLRCVADGIPLPYYEWYLNNTLISTNDEFIINGGNLTVNVAKFKHSGLYMCVAMNDMQEGVHTNVSVGFVNVKAVAPKIKENFQQLIYLFKNQLNSIFCNVSGHPDPEFVWKVNSVTITTGNKFTVHKNGTLEIYNTLEQDSGEYVCTARNAEGNVSQKTTVKVIEKVKIIKSPMNRVFREHTPLAQLLCDAVYEPSLAVHFEWYRNNEKFQQKDDRVYLERRVNGPSRILYFKEILETDAATYLCRVLNMDGNKVISTDEANATIAVISPPVDLKLTGNCEHDKNVTLSWRLTGSFAAIQFVIEYAAPGSNVWKFYEMVVRESPVALEVKKLPPSAQLVFRVSMQGYDYIFDEIIASGPSSVNKELCSTPQGVPILNPQNIRGVATSEGDLKVKWDKLDSLDQPGPGFVLIVSYNKNGEDLIPIKVDGSEQEIDIPHPGIDTEYNLKVYAQNDIGRNKKTEEFKFKSGGKAPAVVVRNLQTLSVSHCCVDLSWDAIPSISSYRIVYQILSKNRRSLEETNFVDVNATNNATLRGLLAATNYKITVSALNGQVAGPASEPITIKTLVQVSKDVDKPQNGKVSIFGSIVYLTWEPPLADEVLMAYTVTYYKYDNPSDNKTLTTSNFSREIYIKDLEKLTYHTIEVAANTKSRKGRPWVVKSVSVAYPDRPGQPDEPQIIALNEKSLNVTFTLPKNYVGDLPNRYYVYYKPEGSEIEALHKVASYPESPWILLDSLKSITYRIYTVGENALGKSLKSNDTTGHPHNPVASARAYHSVPFYEELWFIVLVVVLALLILVCIILCCVLCRGGGKYPVHKKEKLRGGWENEPLKDYTDDPMKELNEFPVGNKFIDAKPPARSGSENSISKKALYSDDDKDSLDDYAEDSRFDEDGSFIGQYGDDKKNGGAVKV